MRFSLCVEVFYAITLSALGSAVTSLWRSLWPASKQKCHQVQGAGTGTQQDLPWESALHVALLAALLSGRNCGNSGPWKLTFLSKPAGTGKAQQEPQTWEAPKIQATFTCWERSWPAVGQTFLKEIPSKEKSWAELGESHFPLCCSPCPTWQPGARGGPEPVPVPSPSWLSLDKERGHPSAQQQVLLPQLAPGDPCGAGTAAIAVLHAWICHLSPGCHTWGSLHNEMMVQFKTETSLFAWNILLLPASRVPFGPEYLLFLKILICFLFKLPASMCLRASSERGRHQELSQHPAGVRAAPMAPGSAGQSTVMGWRGEQEASCYFFFTHPPCQTAYFLPLMVSA